MIKLIKPANIRHSFIRTFRINRQLFQATSTSSDATSLKRIIFRTSLAILGGGIVYDGFNEFEHIGGTTRFLRSLKIAALISFDYSWNLYGIANESEEYKKRIKEINLRCANRILNGCLANGGLYIKIGQGVSAINHILPFEYTNTLKQLEDKCLPRKPDEVTKMFKEEFGKSPEDLFAEFNYKPIAAASLAQVFKAKTLDGNEVAVKIQYHDLIKRFSGDFNTILLLQNIIKMIHKNYNFDWILTDLRKNLEQELDFMHEGKNAERCARDLSKFDYVHVPVVEWSLTTKRILTAEWIDGYKISDLDRIKNDKFNLNEIDKKLFNTFSEQIFNTGFVHADPHPGNVFVRKNKKTGKPDIVLLDHGLYEYLPADTRLSLCKFWEAVVLKDKQKMDKYAKELNVDDSMQLGEVLLQRPIDMRGRKMFTTRMTEEDIAYIQEKAKKRFDIILLTLKQMPRNMLFIVRNLNTIRAIARTHGDPIDRPTYMAKYAQKCIFYSEHLGIFKYIPWLMKRICFEYNLFKMMMYFWFIRNYLNFLTLMGRSPEGSSNIVYYSPDTNSF